MLIRKIVILVILLFSSLYGMEKLYDYFLRQNRNVKVSNVTHDQKDYDVIFHGSCTPALIVSPEVFKEITGKTSYNLGEHNANYAENYLSFLIYLKYHKAPDYLFLDVTPESLDERFNRFQSYRYAHFMNISEVNEVVREMDPDYYKWTRIPFLKYAYYNDKVNFKTIQGGLHKLKDKPRAFYKDGFELSKPAKNMPQIPFKSGYDGGITLIWSEKREKYLRKLVDLAEENGVKVILFNPPMYSETSKLILNKQAIFAKSSTLAKELKLDYINFDTLDMAKNKSNFITTINMSYQGAMEFSDIFSDRMKSVYFSK